MTKQRDLDAIGKTREDVYSFLRDVIRYSPVENIVTFVESLSAKQWHNLLVLVSGDKINRFTTSEWLKDFYTRCPDWRGEEKTVLFDAFDLPVHEPLRLPLGHVSFSAGYAVATALSRRMRS